MSILLLVRANSLVLLSTFSRQLATKINDRGLLLSRLLYLIKVTT